MSLNVFWDNSNIWLVGRKLSSFKEPGNEDGFRIHFKNLMGAVAAGRSVDYALVAGSLPPDNDDLWAYFKKLGAVVETQERGAINGREVAVDQAIQFGIMEKLLDGDEPGTILLLTGDGNGHEIGKGFIPTLQRAVRKGWAVEVASWDGGCNKTLRAYAEEKGKYVSLDPFYEHATFIQKGRRPAPLKKVGG